MSRIQLRINGIRWKIDNDGSPLKILKTCGPIRNAKPLRPSSIVIERFHSSRNRCDQPVVVTIASVIGRAASCRARVDFQQQLSFHNRRNSVVLGLFACLP